MKTNLELNDLVLQLKKRIVTLNLLNQKKEVIQEKKKGKTCSIKYTFISLKIPSLQKNHIIHIKRFIVFPLFLEIPYVWYFKKSFLNFSHLQLLNVSIEVIKTKQINKIIKFFTEIYLLNIRFNNSWKCYFLLFFYFAKAGKKSQKNQKLS